MFCLWLVAIESTDYFAKSGPVTAARARPQNHALPKRRRMLAAGDYRSMLTHLAGNQMTTGRVHMRPFSAARATRGRGSIGVLAERTYVMVKPDGVQRGLVGDIITRFERKGFKMIGLKMFQAPKELAEEHYKDLAVKPFYGKLVEYIISGPVVCIVRAFITTLFLYDSVTHAWTLRPARMGCGANTLEFIQHSHHETLDNLQHCTSSLSKLCVLQLQLVYFQDANCVVSNDGTLKHAQWLQHPVSMSRGIRNHAGPVLARGAPFHAWPLSL